MRSASLYGSMLNAGCAHVGPSRAHVEPSWAHRLMLGQVERMLSHVGPILGLYWPRLGLWPMLGYVGPILGPCRAYVGPMLAYVAPMLSPSWSPKPRKNGVFFLTSRSAVKKTMFLNTASKIHRKLQWLQLAAPITFGYYRRPPEDTGSVAGARIKGSAPCRRPLHVGGGKRGVRSVRERESDLYLYLYLYLYIYIHTHIHK